jgi:hypothetical protein
MRKPLARVYYRGGRSEGWAADSEQGRTLFQAAARLIEIAPPKRARSSSGPS